VNSARWFSQLGSLMSTFASGLHALIALPTPVISPPPPIAQMTVRTSGQSSTISSPIVPCPAMKA